MMKNYLRLFDRSLSFIVIGMFFTFISYGQASIGWKSGFPSADAVNVGSSKSADFVFQFEVLDAPIPNAKIEVQFPSYAADYYDPILHPAYHPGGGFIDYTGKINWDPATRILTFSGIDLATSNDVMYTIPHFATDALPLSVTSGQITISVKDGSDALIDSRTVTFNYNRAQLSVESPTTAAPNQSGLALEFGTNTWSYIGDSYTAKTYRFGLRIANGSVDSVRVKVAIPKTVHEVTSGSWTANGITVNRVTTTSEATNNIYTLYLDKSFSVFGDGFNDADKIDIAFDLNKRYCGDTEVMLSAAWGRYTDYVSSALQTGSFKATAPIGTPDLRREKLHPVTIAGLQNSDGKLNMDGVTPNIFWTKVKNYSTTAPACDLLYTLSTSGTPFASYFEEGSPVKISRNGGATWTTVPSTDITWSGSKGNDATGTILPKPQFRSKKTKLELKISSIDPGEELIIEWQSYISPDAFYNAPGVEREWYRSIRHDDKWDYTDKCRETSFSIASTNIYSKADIIKGMNYGPMIKLTTSVPTSGEVKVLQLSTTALSGSYPELNQNDSHYKIHVKLPKGITIADYY